jgi:hypothetical protein
MQEHMMEGVIKSLGTFIPSMTKSCYHCNDPYHYTVGAIKQKLLVKSISSFAVFYFYMCSTECLDIDGVLEWYLGNFVKADSICFSFDNKSSHSYNNKNETDIVK